MQQCCVIFFFKQKTAYEMRISDWSSDVCSSDLAESIHIMREVAAEADKPVMLYSVGKDSAVMLHLARKAFFPSPPPFPLLHDDTTWKFQAMYELRDRAARDAGLELLPYQNPEAKAIGITPFDNGSRHPRKS